MALLILSSVHQDYKIFRCLRLQQVELPAYDANLCLTLTSAYFWSQDATVSRLKARSIEGTLERHEAEPPGVWGLGMNIMTKHDRARMLKFQKIKTLVNTCNRRLSVSPAGIFLHL